MTIILQLLDRDGIKLTKASGREYFGECPWCGGRDRFRVWPAEKDIGAFWCRACRKGGDAITYQRITTGMGYFDACAELGVTPNFERRQAGNKDQIRKSVMPPHAWRKKAHDIATECNEKLFSDAGATLLEYITKTRGISARAARAACLGLNPNNRFWERPDWGLPSETNPATGKPRKVFLPAGLVIPTRAAGEMVRLRVRLQNPNDGQRYMTIAGAGSHPMRWGHGMNAFVVVESELDAILLSQQAGDMAAVIALGSAQARPDADAHAELAAASRILVALDTDEAGAAQINWWRRRYGDKVVRWPVPDGKDPGEAHQLGLDLREWLQAGLED